MISYLDIFRLLQYKVLGKNISSDSFQNLARKIKTGCNQIENIGVSGNIHKTGEANAIDSLNLNETSVVFDVGANKGDFINIINKKASVREIHAFEPTEESFSILKQRYKKETTVKLNKLGLSSNSGKREIYSDPKNDLLSSFHQRDLSNTSFCLSKTEEVETITIDKYVEEQNIQFINLLKLDAEGHEIEILNGAKISLNESRIGNILFEFGGCNIDSRTYLKDFFDILDEKFYVYRVLQNALYHFDYSEKEEAFQTTVFLAKLKKL